MITVIIECAFRRIIIITSLLLFGGKHDSHPAPNSEGDYFSRREGSAATRGRGRPGAVLSRDRPTVARVRAALGGGSPNNLAPALKQWKESFAPAPTSGTRTEAPAILVQISDLAQELW
jgi:hypothetical protein